MGIAFSVGAELCRWLASGGFATRAFSSRTSELQPARPSTPDSSVSVVDTGLEWIEREFPFKSDSPMAFLVLFYSVPSQCVAFMASTSRSQLFCPWTLSSRFTVIDER